MAKQFRFLIFLANFLLVFSLLYLTIFILQIGSCSKTSSAWIGEILKYKEHRAMEFQNKKKILVISGSNALFGIDSHALEKLGLPVINLSSNADMDISYFRFQAENNMGTGDIVILPLEFEHYSRKNLTSSFIENMIFFGESYWNWLSFSEKFRFLRSVPPKRILSGLIQTVSGAQCELSDLKVIESSIKHKEIGEWNGYSYKSMNKKGDILVSTNTQKGMDAFSKRYEFNTFTLSNHFINEFKKIKRVIQERDGLLILTYPVMVRSSSFNLKEEESQMQIEKLRSTLSQQSIEIQCNPALFNIRNTLFLDTAYHPNITGAKVRSENLVSCIKNIMQGSFKITDYTEGIDRTIQLEKNYISELN